MSLFVGNVSKHVSHRQLEQLFKKHGKCRIDLRDRYAFVQFDNDNHAQAAKKQLQHQTFHGLQLNIQWSKNSGRFGENNKRGGGGGMRKRSRSRQNKWKRDDRWGRRSPSAQRRSSPSYSGNKDFQDFQPKCPRDQIILKKLLQKKKQTQRKYGQRSRSQKHTDRDKQNQKQKNQSKQNGDNNNKPISKQIIEQQPNHKQSEQQMPAQQQQDGQIPVQ